ncbi:MAG: hypothetical protein J3K34DRAFT_227144 [Monoraphidium minutum]|nr:MAG: hypothetical protein J3K34DRAFT_227144 [Monoraphidium minutum]
MRPPRPRAAGHTDAVASTSGSSECGCRQHSGASRQPAAASSLISGSRPMRSDPCSCSASSGSGSSASAIDCCCSGGGGGGGTSGSSGLRERGTCAGGGSEGGSGSVRRSPHRRPARGAAAAAPLLLAAACLCASAAAAAAAAAPLNAAAGAGYKPWSFNKVCLYSASAVPGRLFEDGLDGGLDFLFPLETNQAVNRYERPWEACFAGDEPYNLPQIASGWKLPCRYTKNADGSYEFEEEHACEVLVKSNCYCYALDRFVGSYCEPGLGGTGQPFQLPVNDCSKATAGVIADGGRPVDRDAVYNSGGARPGGGHYIALAIKPASGPDDTGDFHFWRYDSNGAWSYKAGDTLVRNTLRNGSTIRDIENDPKARGIYSMFCGYFAVVPATHKLVGNQFWYSSLPSRYRTWGTNGVRGAVAPMPKLSDAWMAAYRDYFAETGWEDGEDGPGGAGGGYAGYGREGPRTHGAYSNKERAAAAAAAGGRRGGPGGAGASAPRPPHWYSVRAPA